MVDNAWLQEISDVEEAAALTAHLVSFKSYPGEEAAVQQAVADWCRENGLEPVMQDLVDGRQNVIVTITNGDGPTMLLNGHVDTALAADNWEHDPWTARRDGDRMSGLGAADMKSGVAAMLLATRALNQRRDLWQGTLICTSVVDEEAFSVGAKGLVDDGIQADACIVTEPSGEQLVVGGVGKVLVVGEVTGRASHGSHPEAGINAAEEGAKFVARMSELPLGEHPHMHASQSLLSFLSGSSQYIITVPEKARFLINRHTVAGESGDQVLEGVNELADDLNSPATFQFTIEPPYYPAWETDPGAAIVKRLAAAFNEEYGRTPELGYMEGVADANYFSTDSGIPTVMFGPTGDKFHQANEWVNVPSIAACVRILVRASLATFNRE